MPEVSRTTFGFSRMVTPLKPRLFAYSKAAVTMRRAALRVMTRTLTARSGPGTFANGLNLGCEARAARTLSGGFVKSAAGFLANVVQGIASKTDAGTHADVEVKLLPHGHDRAVVHEAFALQFRLQLRLRRLVWLGGNRAEQAELVLSQQINGAVGQRVALVAPALPADVGVNVVGVESDSFQHADRFR